MRERKKLQIPYNVITELIEETAGKYQDKKIHFWEDKDHEESLTYSQLCSEGKRIATVLRKKGIEKNDAVLMQLPFPGMYARIFWGLQFAGAVPMALPFAFADNAGIEVLEKELNICRSIGKLKIVVPRNYGEQYQSVISGFDNISLLVYEDLIGEAESAGESGAPDINGDDMCCVLFSSGSTDLPKGVVITHATMLASIYGALDIIDYNSKDIVLSWLPLTHAFGFIGFHLLPAAIGAEQMIMPPAVFVQNPKWFLELVSDRGVTVFGAMNFAFSLFNGCMDEEERGKLLLHGVKHIFVGGEPVNPEIADSFLETFSPAGLPPEVVRPIYGLSESAFAVAVAQNHQRFRTDILDREILSKEKRAVKALPGDTASSYVSVGRPVTGLDFIVADDEGNPLPEGYIGEFCYKGDCISNRYFFHENEKNKKMAGEYLASGDMGYYSEGEIVLTGRKKDIIFINGQNYYPMDIENMIGRLKEKYKGKVIASQIYNYKSVPELVLFVESHDELQQFLTEMKELDRLIKNIQFLPFKYYIPVEEIPATANGKVKRSALADQYRSGQFEGIIRRMQTLSGEDFDSVQPENETDQALQQLWNQVIRGGEINNASSNFFEAGGDSVKLLQLSVRLKENFGIEVSLKKLIKAMDLRSFLDICHAEMTAGHQKERVTVDAEPEKWYEPFALTEIQRSYLLGRNEAYDMGGISTHGYYEYETHLDIGRFEQALNKVIRHQDNLRLVMTGDLQQRVLEDVPWYEIRTIDCRGLTEEETEQKKLTERARMSHAVFDPYNWPLFEFEFLELDGDHQILLVGIDLLIIDASGIQMLKKMIMEVYRKPETELTPLSFRFRDFMSGMALLKASEQYQEDKEFWLSRLDQIPPSPELPLSKPTESADGSTFRRLAFAVSGDRAGELRRMADSNGISLSAVICTAFAMALSEFSNQQDMTLNVTVFNKYDFHPDVDRMMGDFTSTILLPFHFQKNREVREIFEGVQTEILHGLEHRLYSGVEILRDLKHKRSMGNRAIMPVVFTSTLDKPFDKNGDFGELVYSVSQTSQVYLDCQAGFSDEKIVITWDYREELFEEEMICSAFDLFEQIVKNIRPESVLNEYMKLSETDRMLWTTYNSTEESDIVSGTLVELFEKAVGLYPGNIAVKDGESCYTYQELNDAADAVAEQLAIERKGRGDLIAVEGYKRKETIAAILGILKSGAAYVPLDPENPASRKKKILEDSGASLISDSALLAVEHPERKSTSRKESIVKPDDVAYVIYTSGSTGMPKGVVIAHGSAANTVQDINRKYHVTESDRVIGLSALSFDLSVYDIFGTFAAGARLVLAEESRNIRAVADTVSEEGITVWNSVPAFVQMYAEELKQRQLLSGDKDESGMNCSLRLMIMSGDWIPVDLPETIQHYIPGIELVSMGGATEASIWSIYYPVKTVNQEMRSIPYGYPLANQSFYVMGYWDDVCPVDVAGELCIGGAGLAVEYRNHPEQTESAFFEHPVYGRLYRTGDYGVFRRQGYIEFLGRKDSQIKIRGHRIELGEINKALMNHDGIKEVVSIKKTFDTGSEGIVSFITSESEMDETEIKAELQEHLPEYMIPSVIVRLHCLPLTGNGKTDMKALEEMEIRMEDGGRTEGKNELEPVIKEIWENVLGVSNISFTQNFYDIGGDSVKLFKIINKVELELNHSFPKDLYFAFETVEEMAEILLEAS